MNKLIIMLVLSVNIFAANYQTMSIEDALLDQDELARKVSICVTGTFNYVENLSSIKEEGTNNKLTVEFGKLSRETRKKLRRNKPCANGCSNVTICGYFNYQIHVTDITDTKGIPGFSSTRAAKKEKKKAEANNKVKSNIFAYVAKITSVEDMSDVDGNYANIEFLINGEKYVFEMVFKKKRNYEKLEGHTVEVVYNNTTEKIDALYSMNGKLID